MSAPRELTRVERQELAVQVVGPMAHGSCRDEILAALDSGAVAFWSDKVPRDQVLVYSGLSTWLVVGCGLRGLAPLPLSGVKYERWIRDLFGGLV